jgi:acyl-CoA synthetase (NDP forming)
VGAGAEKGAASRAFFDEHRIYGVLSRAGLAVPRHEWLEEARAPTVFGRDDEVVVKGQADGLWHKTEAGAVRFVRGAEVEATVAELRERLPGWRGALVCERVESARSALPSEGFVSLSFRQGLMVAVLGLGGLAVEALGQLVPPLIWPLELMTGDEALAELEAHLLGQVWLGRVRGTSALTDRAALEGLVGGIWRLGGLARAEGLGLIEVNPLVVDMAGRIVALDGVGSGAASSVPRHTRKVRPLLHPHRVALLGVPSGEGPGRVIAENLIVSKIEIVFIKAGVGDTLLGRPCVSELASLRTDPVDLLVVAVPARAAVEVVEDLIAMGGGAEVVGLVAGGIGDGADHGSLGERLAAALANARGAGRWAPTVLGPNWLGEVIPGLGLDTTFIPRDRWDPKNCDGSLALISQSGAFVLSRLSSRPGLGLGFALTLGNQLDLDAADVMSELPDPIDNVGLYLEGLGGDMLGRACRAISKLRERGVRVVVYRAGRSDAGHVAAASHTGAIAGDDRLEVEALRRAGATLADSMSAFESALSWLGRYPKLSPTCPVVVSNAGFETVCAADLIELASLDEDTRTELAEVLARHRLKALVAPRLPLDLTPMADLDAWLEVIELLAGKESALVLGLVPFTPRLDRHRIPELAAALVSLPRPVAVVIDAGPDGDWLREPLTAAGVLVFASMEQALSGLRCIA